MQAIRITKPVNADVIIVEAEVTERRQPTAYSHRDWQEYESKPRVYFWEDGESILDHLANRRCEPYRIYRKVLDNVLQDLGVTYDRANWSQRAGCTMCPCSPGFILTGVPYPAKFDVFVKVRIIAPGTNADSASRQFDREAVSAG